LGDSAFYQNVSIDSLDARALFLQRMKSANLHTLRLTANKVIGRTPDHRGTLFVISGFKKKSEGIVLKWASLPACMPLCPDRKIVSMRIER